MTRNLEKVLDTDPDFFTAERLAEVTESEIREKVFDGNEKFALVDERARLVRQLGQRVKETGMSLLALVRANSSCPKLAKAIVDTFEGFRD